MCKKLICNLYDRNEYFFHIRTLKKAVNHRLFVVKVHMNDFQKAFPKLMFKYLEKNIKNLEWHGNMMKIVTSERKTNYLLS